MATSMPQPSFSVWAWGTKVWCGRVVLATQPERKYRVWFTACVPLQSGTAEIDNDLHFTCAIMQSPQWIPLSCL